MLSVKQGGIKYHFLCLWYDSTWDWTPVSRTIGEHSTHFDDKSPNLLGRNWLSVIKLDWTQMFYLEERNDKQ